MIKLKDEVRLQSKVDTITMMEFRHSPGEIMDKVMYGQTIIVTRSGKPQAMIIPYLERHRKPTIKELEEILSQPDQDIVVLPNGEIRGKSKKENP